MRYLVTRSFINVIGYIWQPGIGPCAMSYSLSPADLAELGDPTNREDVTRWIDTHSGDFREIIDFEADFAIGDKDIGHDWADPDSAVIYADAMGEDE